MSLELRGLIICQCRVHFTPDLCTQQCPLLHVPLLPQTCMNQSYLFIATWRHTGTRLWIASDVSWSISCGSLCVGNRQCMYCMGAVLARTSHWRLKWDLVDNLVSFYSRSMPRHLRSMTTSKYDQHFWYVTSPEELLAFLTQFLCCLTVQLLRKLTRFMKFFEVGLGH